MSENNLILDFRGDLLELILQTNKLDFKDIVSFSCTCKDFYYSFNNSKSLWKLKFFQRWPSLLKVYSELTTKELLQINWLEEVKMCLEMRKNLGQKLRGMSKSHFGKKTLLANKVPEVKELQSSIANPRMYLTIIDELLRILNESTEIHKNLTVKYYAKFLLRYMKQGYVTTKLQDFMNSCPKNQQLLEIGMVLISDWFQPQSFVLQSQTLAVLDGLADRVEELLRRKNPLHPLFNVPCDIRKQWKTQNLDNHQFSETATKQVIINSIYQVLFEDLGFVILNAENLNQLGNLEFLFNIDKVLACKIGGWKVLWVVFESIARRLGVRMEIVKYLDLAKEPSTVNSFIGWKSDYTQCENNKFHPADYLNKDFMTRLLDGRSVESLNKDDDSTSKVLSVKERMITITKIISHFLNQSHTKMNDGEVIKYFTSTYEFCAAVSGKPCDHFYESNLLKYTKFNVHTPDFINYLTDTNKIPNDLSIFPLVSHIFNEKSEGEMAPRSRVGKDIKYAVGDIVQQYVYGGVHVITGWEKGMKHIWYHVLRENGTFDIFCQDSTQHPPMQHKILRNQYCALRPCPIENQELGRYFSEFNGYNYIPNEQLKRMYPEDTRARVLSLSEKSRQRLRRRNKMQSHKHRAKKNRF